MFNISENTQIRGEIMAGYKYKNYAPYGAAELLCIESITNKNEGVQGLINRDKAEFNIIDEHCAVLIIFKNASDHTKGTLYELDYVNPNTRGTVESMKSQQQILLERLKRNS